MNNQKDTQETSINTYGESNVSNDKALVDIPIYEFANKKTEKLVTALYLVSDCMDTDDALKGKLRLLGVELLSDIYKLSTLSPIEKHNYISVSLTHIYELLSFIEIACAIGFISEMNTEILKKEFSSLASSLKENITKDKHFTFTLDEKMFDLPKLGNKTEDLGFMNHNFVKDTSIGQISKRTAYDTMSFTNNKSPLQTIQTKRTIPHIANLVDRQDRVNKIIALIKDQSVGRVGLPASETGVSIKDISLAFTNCSEKTIQRELNSLVSKGQLKKTGAKRWSRYAIVEGSK